MPTNSKRPRKAKAIAPTTPASPLRQKLEAVNAVAKRYSLTPHDFGELALHMIGSHSTRANLLNARNQLSLVRGDHLTREAEKVAALDRAHLEAATKFETLFRSICHQLSIDVNSSDVQIASDRSGFALLVKAHPTGTADVPPK